MAFIILFMGAGCRGDVAKTVRRFYGKKVDLNWEKECITYDSILNDCSFTPIKIVSFVERGLCGSCFANYVKAASNYMNIINNDSVMYVCVIQNGKSYTQGDSLRGMTTPRVKVVLDVNNSSLKRNSIEEIPSIIATFLLDSNNRIAVIGDPLRSPKIKDLYDEMIKQLLTNNGIMQ